MERDLVSEYFAYLRVEKGLSANSLINYGHDLCKLSEFAGRRQKQVHRLDKHDLSEYFKLLGQIGLAPRSVARTISSVRG